MGYSKFMFITINIMFIMINTLSQWGLTLRLYIYITTIYREIHCNRIAYVHSVISFIRLIMIQL